MTSKIELLYKKYFNTYSNKCVNYSSDRSCSSQRCVCSAVSEVMAYMENCLPTGMHNYEFYDFNGICNGEEVIDKNSLKIVLSKISNYCFNKDIQNFNISRNDLNSMSYMDNRFIGGTNLIIHGNEKIYNDGSRKKSGKTLLASLVMKEAIWRRIFATNKSFTYMYSPLSKIIDDRLSKRDVDNILSYRNVDWLCIDDIYDKDRQINANIMEDVFVHRQIKNLPTIYILKFDASSRNNLNQIVGESMTKCFFGVDNTFIVDVS